VAEPSIDRRLFRENLAQAMDISLHMHRCGAGMAEAVARTRAVIAESRDLIAVVDNLLLRENVG
jgi:hypothetical protein